MSATADEPGPVAWLVVSLEETALESESCKRSKRERPGHLGKAGVRVVDLFPRKPPTPDRLSPQQRLEIAPVG